MSKTVAARRSASPRVLLAAFVLLLPLRGAEGQTRPSTRPHLASRSSPSTLPVPDQTTALKMVWGIMAAVDQANRTGNYSVLRDLGSAAFQTNNNPATLGAIFAGLRAQGVDLSNTLVVNPLWEIAPTMVSSTTLRIRGAFPLRPSAIQFDLLFAWDHGWRLDAVAVQAK